MRKHRFAFGVATICLAFVAPLFISACIGGTQPAPSPSPSVMPTATTAGTAASPVAAAPGTTHAIPSATMPLSPYVDPIPTLTPTPIPKATVSPAPQAAPTANAGVPQPTPQVQPTVAPTPTAQAIVDANLSHVLPWASNPPDKQHQLAAQALADIWRQDVALARELAGLPWIAGGLQYQASDILSDVRDMVVINPASTDQEVIASHLSPILPWAQEPPDVWHRLASETLADIWLHDAEIAGELAAMPWIADGVTEGELYGLGGLLDLRDTIADHPSLAERLLQHWRAHGYADLVFWHVYVTSLVDEGLAIHLLEMPWVADGLSQPESNILDTLNGRLPVDAQLARWVYNLPWIADGITELESSAAEELIHTWRSDPDLVKLVADILSVADGVTQNQQLVLWGLSVIAYSDAALARQVIDPIADLLALPGNLPAYTLESMGYIGEFPDDLKPLVEQPWFADGLSREEAAFITTLTSLVYDSPELYAGLLEVHFAQSRTIELPLAGEVNIWAFSNAPFPPEDDLLGVMEEAARVLEGFMATSFPTTDIIMLVVVPNAAAGIHWVGEHQYRYMRVGKFGDYNFDENPYVIRHEIAHYYFGIGFAPVWLREGAADFMSAYVDDRAGGLSLTDRKAAVARSLTACTDAGVENISHLISLYDPLRDTPGCAYTMGENFLHQAVDAIGEKSVAAALRELFHLIPSRDSLLLPGTEEEIHRVFLSNTPPGREDAFRDIYRRYHGGVYVK